MKSYWRGVYTLDHLLLLILWLEHLGKLDSVTSLYGRYDNHTHYNTSLLYLLEFLFMFVFSRCVVAWILCVEFILIYTNLPTES